MERLEFLRTLFACFFAPTVLKVVVEPHLDEAMEAINNEYAFTIDYYGPDDWKPYTQRIPVNFPLTGIVGTR